MGVNRFLLVALTVVGVVLIVTSAIEGRWGYLLLIAVLLASALWMEYRRTRRMR
jgi:hypothetical protein